MKKTILIALVTFTFFGCSFLDSESFRVITIQGQQIPTPTSSLRSDCVINLEGCEYFVVDAHYSYTYVHKGNCKNPIHPENRVERK